LVSTLIIVKLAILLPYNAASEDCNRRCSLFVVTMYQVLEINQGKNARLIVFGSLLTILKTVSIFNATGAIVKIV